MLLTRRDLNIATHLSVVSAARCGLPRQSGPPTPDQALQRFYKPIRRAVGEPVLRLPRSSDQRR